MRLSALAATFGIATIGLLAACNDPIHAEDQIQIAVGASRTVIAPTDTVIFAGSIQNFASSDLPLSRPCGRPFQFEVLNAAGAVVLDSNGPDFTCATDSTSTTIALRGGQALTSNLGLIGLLSDGSPLPAGVYTLRASAVVAGAVRRSPTIQLTVTGATTT